MLQRRLLIILGTVLVLASALIGFGSVLALRDSLQQQVDERLLHLPPLPVGAVTPGQPQGRIGQLSASVALMEDGQPQAGTAVGEVVDDRGDTHAVTAAQLQQVWDAFSAELPTASARASHTQAGQSSLNEASASDVGKPRTLTVDGLGTYRVLVRVVDAPSSPASAGAVHAAGAEGATQAARLVVTGESEAPMRAIVHKAAVDAVLIGLGGVLVALVVAWWLVRRSFAGLRRLAHTARSMTHSLSDPATQGRLVAADGEELPSNPRSEVGQVGIALSELATRVNASFDERDRYVALQNQFVADASHELRTPLSAIRGYAELSQRSGEAVGPTTATAIKRIGQESVRLSALVEDLLALARLDAAEHEQHGGENDARCNVVDVAQQVLADASTTQPERPWELVAPEAPVWVPGTNAQWTQVLTNLVGNAKQHTDVAVAVSVTIESTPEHMVHVAVIDAGPGIDEAVLPHLFERFRTGDAARSGTSTGLGLAIVKAIVAKLGGTISATNHPTTFLVEVPEVGVGHAHEPPTAPSGGKGKRQAPRG